MLPLILGGIALAAVGYGVKEICESEGCPWDEPYSSPTVESTTNLFQIIETLKKELYETHLPTLERSLSDTQRKKQWDFHPHPVPPYERLSTEDTADDIELYGEIYLDMLSHIRDSIIYITEVIDRQSASDKVYKNWTKEYKKLAKNGYDLWGSAHKVLALELLSSGELHIEAITPLKSYKKELEALGIY